MAIVKSTLLLPDGAPLAGVLVSVSLASLSRSTPPTLSWPRSRA